jgi:hypothetical protein
MDYHNYFEYNNTSFYTYSREYTISNIIKGQSLIRLGDGEFDIIKGKSLYFQKYEKEIQDCLINLLKIINSKKLMIGHYFKFNKNDRWDKFMNIIIEKNNSIDKIYYHDTLIFRSKKDWTLFIPLYNYFKNKKFIIIHPNISNFDFITDLCNEYIFIKCKDNNCYDQYKDILKEILTYNNEYIIILSCGPTAKLLGHKLYNMNYQVIDFGAGYKSVNSLYIRKYKKKINNILL